MRLPVSPEGAIKYTKFSVFLVFTWPPWPDSSKLEKNLFEAFSWIFIIIPTVLVVMFFNAARYQLDDHLSFTKTICVTVASFQVVIKMIICKRKRSQLEVLHVRVREFVASATPHERKILQRYVDRCSVFHLAINICALLGNIAMLCGPFFLPQSLPIDVDYPFSVEERPAWDLAYLQQSIVGFQCASIGSVDCQAALLIWYAGARFELLAEEFQNVKNIREFHRCVRKHQILLENTEEMIQAVRYIILTTIVMTIISIITGGIHIVSQEPFPVKVQFFTIAFGFMGALFISARPAENLLNMCAAVGQGAYNCSWTEAPAKFRQSIIFVMLRSQQTSSISVAGILPTLSLSYYAAFLSSTYSFFTTLRIVVEKVKD